MNVTIPASTNHATGTTVRSILASALNAILTHSRSLDGKEMQFESASVQAAPGKIERAIAFLTETSEARELRLQQAYLSEATDLYDLEYRSREWDRKARLSTSW